MSLPVTKFYCKKCDFEGGDVGTWGMHEYVLPNSVRIPINRLLGWCDDCDQIASVELFSRTESEKEVQQAEDAVEEHMQLLPRRRWWQLHQFVFYWIWKHRVTEWESKQFDLLCKLDDAKDVVVHLQQRKTPPRCLECGSRKVHAPVVTNSETDEYLEEKPCATGFVHPGCGGEIWMRMDGMRIALKPSVKYYTPEGDLIEKEFVEGYTLPVMKYFFMRNVANAKARGREIPLSVITKRDKEAD
jgi:hypothetical protein